MPKQSRFTNLPDQEFEVHYQKTSSLTKWQKQYRYPRSRGVWVKTKYKVRAKSPSAASIKARHKPSDPDQEDQRLPRYLRTSKLRFIPSFEK